MHQSSGSPKPTGAPLLNRAGDVFTSLIINWAFDAEPEESLNFVPGSDEAFVLKEVCPDDLRSLQRQAFAGVRRGVRYFFYRPAVAHPLQVEAFVRSGNISQAHVAVL